MDSLLYHIVQIYINEILLCNYMATFFADVELLLVTVVVEPAVNVAFRFAAEPPGGHTVLVAQVVVRFFWQPMKIRGWLV